MRRPSPPRVFVVLALLLLLQVSSLPTAHADAFTVTKTEDTNDGTCDSDCSLREAVIAANASLGGDVITIPAGIYTLTRSGPTEDGYDATVGDLDLLGDIELRGAGAEVTIISAEGLADGEEILYTLDTRVFDITGDVLIQDLTVADGDLVDNDPDSNGGGIRSVNGQLELTRVAVRGNEVGNNGGGIFVDSGSLLTITDSTIADNFAAGTDATDGGGGLFIGGSSDNVLIDRSLFVGNFAARRGGGVSNLTNTTNIYNSTFSNNEALDGGAIYNDRSVTDLRNVTITGNATNNEEAAAFVTEQGFTSLGNVVIANSSGDFDCKLVGEPGFADNGGNLVEDDSCGFEEGSDPLLGPLADNGGPTQTHPPLDGSPLIDSGNNGICSSPQVGNVDQRGVVRPQNATGDEVNDCDIGAVEVGNLPAEPPNLPVLLSATVGDGGDTLNVTGRLSDVPHTNYEIAFFSAAFCEADGPDGDEGEGISLLNTGTVTTNGSGNVYFNLSLALNEDGLSGRDFVTARASASGENSDFSRCTTVDPNNTSWPNALPLDLSGSPESPTASTSQYIDSPGQTRWYKFSVQPSSQAVITLGNLPADYNLTVYGDIDAAYQKLFNNSDDLTLLNAEFAPEAFSPEAFSPEAFSPEAFSPEAFSPEAFSPEAFSPLVFSPEAFSPEAFSPEAFSPEAFSPEAFSPEAFSPEAFSPEAFSPEAFSPEAFSPEAFSAAQTQNILGVSSFTGVASEGLHLNTWANADDFYVRVTGRNGAFSLASPYTLDVTLLTGGCRNVSAALPETSLASVPGNFETLILADFERLGAGGIDPTTAQARLATLAARPDVRGTIIDVSGDVRIAAANQQADANTACPYAKNLVANSIKRVVERYRADNPLRYLVLVGNDEVIPFYRYPDEALLAAEQNFVPPVRDDTASQASLRLSYVLGQDEYGSTLDIARGPSALPIPDLAVGRLVETPDEIVTVVDAYLATPNGVAPTPASALVTGYDFLFDAAQAVQSELSAGLGGPVDALLTAGDVSPTDPRSWTADQLRTALLGQRHDLVYLAGHFSASGALAADYETRLAAGEVASSPVDLTNALIFSAGCHSGYNVVNSHAVNNLTETPDWAQAFARKGATFIGGTGYQYGDTDFIEYGERLYLEFSSQLRRGSGPVAVGEALTQAKRTYLAETTDLRGIHEKTVLQSTLFGLPMLRVDLPNGRGTPPAEPSIVPGTNPYAANPGAALGLRFADVTIDPALTRLDIPLQNVRDNSSVTAVYWTGSDGAVSNPAEPVLPLERSNVNVPGQTLRGVGFRSGSFADTVGRLPLTGAPTTEIRGVHAPFLSDTFFPVQFYRANYLGALIDGVTRFNVTPIQYKSGVDPATSTERRFSQLAFRLFYSSYTGSGSDGNQPALAAPPTISQIGASVEDNGVDDGVDSEAQFRIRVVGDPSAGVQEVWITYTGDGNLAGQWQSLDLTQTGGDSTLWTGSLPLSNTTPGTLRFVVQAANGVGLVSLAANEGAYYPLSGTLVDPGQPGDPGPAPTALSLLAPPTSGRYGETVPVRAQLLDQNGTPLANQRLTFKLGGQQRSATTVNSGEATVNFPLFAAPNQYSLGVGFAGNETDASSTAAASFRLNKQDTLLNLAPASASAPVDSEAGLVATLRDVQNRPLREESVIFLVSDGSNSYNVPIITDFSGRARLRNVPLPAGAYTVDAYFSGNIPLPGGALTIVDALYNPSTASASLTLTPLTQPQPVKPVLECVVENGPGDFTARFGYLNENGETVGIPVGGDNKFSPDPQDRGQPTDFAPGRVVEAFGVDFDGSNLVWTLTGPDGSRRTATASSGSTRCAGEPEPEARVLYLSSSTGGRVDGVSFRDEDILGYSLETGEWFLLFDGSDAGLARNDINAFHILGDGSILMSLNRWQQLPSLGWVRDTDVLRFVPASLGAQTAGSFELYLDGYSVGLIHPSKDIDALSIAPDGRLLISTLGNAFVPASGGGIVFARDEDIIALNGDGRWSFYFDGSDVGLTRGSEDVWALWVDVEGAEGDTGELYLSTAGRYRANGSSGNGDSVFICAPQSLGYRTDCTLRDFVDGSTRQSIDGLSVAGLLPAFDGKVQVADVDDAPEVDEALDDDVEESDIFLPLINR